MNMYKYIYIYIYIHIFYKNTLYISILIKFHLNPIINIINYLIHIFFFLKKNLYYSYLVYIP